MSCGNREGSNVIMLKYRPSFEISESKDGGYLVLVSWPKGPEQQLDGFASVEAARSGSKRTAQTGSPAALTRIDSRSSSRAVRAPVCPRHVAALLAHQPLPFAADMQHGEITRPERRALDGKATRGEGTSPHCPPYAAAERRGRSRSRSANRGPFGRCPGNAPRRAGNPTGASARRVPECRSPPWSWRDPRTARHHNGSGPSARIRSAGT